MPLYGYRDLQVTIVGVRIVSSSQWLKVPLGPHGPRWRTMPTARAVLAVVHTVTAINRLADILPVFDSDRRVQVIYTCPQASAVANGVEEYLAASGALVMPWEQAIVTEFDLALSVHSSGNLHDINAPLVILSHGIGYTKYSTGNRKPETGNRKPETGNRKPETGNRKPETGNRKPETGNRKPETGNRSVYGLSRESLVRDGSVVASAIVLSHQEEYRRLADAVPEALDAAVVAGDPCFDRLAVSQPRRRHYREVLGARDDTTVVLVTSTWGPHSLLGRNPDLIAQLLAELTSDRHIVAAVLHPNAWFAHGPAQIRLWLGDCLRAGLRLVPPAAGWQQAILASDVVIGDHGAVTGYGASLGRATLLASFPDHQVAAGSAMAALGRTARRLDPALSFTEQFDLAIADAAADRFAEVRELATSLPGRSSSVLTKIFYDLMSLREPRRREPLVAPYAPAELRPEQAPMAAWWVTAGWRGEREVEVARWPADVDARPEHPPNRVERHLVVDRDHPRRDLHGNAAIVLLEHVDEVPAVFEDRPACVLAVAGNRVVHRDKTVSITLSDPTGELVAVCASAIYAWLALGRTWQALPGQVIVTIGSRQVRATITGQSAP